MDESQHPYGRRAVASLASAILAVLLLVQITSLGPPRSAEGFFLCTLIAVPAIAGALIWSRRLSAQLLARAAWWSFLLSGALVATVTSTDVSRLGCDIVVCCAIALLACGASGLGATSGRFQPVAFRGTLIASLVLAIADTGALLWIGTASALFERHADLILLVPLMLTGVIGLLRLRTWGLIANLASNVLVAALGWSGVLHLPGPLRGLFVGSAIAQFLIPLPMLMTIILRLPPRPDRWPRAKVWAASTLIAAIAGLSFYAAFVHDGPLFLL